MGGSYFIVLKSLTIHTNQVPTATAVTLPAFFKWPQYSKNYKTHEYVPIILLLSTLRLRI